MWDFISQNKNDDAIEIVHTRLPHVGELSLRDAIELEHFHQDTRHYSVKNSLQMRSVRINFQRLENNRVLQNIKSVIKAT